MPFKRLYAVTIYNEPAGQNASVIGITRFAPTNPSPIMITWSSTFETGVKSIDRDHASLIQCLNELEQAIAAGKGSRKIPETLATLEKYARDHFLREELCMHKVACPMAATNAAAHKSFLAQVAHARERCESPNAGAFVATEIHRRLCVWMTEHILQVDVVGLRSCRRSALADLK